VSTIHRLWLPWARVIHGTSVSEIPRGIENEKIRRADSAEGARHNLAGIHKVFEMPPRSRCLIAQSRNVIIGMRFDVVAANGYPGDVRMGIGDRSQFTFHRLDVRAVVACEDDNARPALGEGTDRCGFAVEIREGDIGKGAKFGCV
jgi:hypothetical protein